MNSTLDRYVAPIALSSVIFYLRLSIGARIAPPRNWKMMTLKTVFEQNTLKFLLDPSVHRKKFKCFSARGFAPPRVLHAHATVSTGSSNLHFISWTSIIKTPVKNNEREDPNLWLNLYTNIRHRIHN